jgi:SAM-dependent methyltransferase
MYTRSAPYYDLLYGFKDYERAAADIDTVIRSHRPEARSLLDVGCGTGRHLEHLRASYEVEGLDINKEMLALARHRLPEVPLHAADMVDFDLQRKFDVVACLFSSVAYVRTPERLFSAVASMGRHLNPGGLLVLEPWFTPESYWTGTITANFVDEPEIKITWMYTSDEPEGRIVALDIHYMVGTAGGIELFNELHELGLFTESEYRGAIEAIDLTVLYDPQGPFGRGLYLGHG